MHGESNISPNIYLNNYYGDYVSGKASLPSIVNDIINTYHKNKVRRSVDIQYFLNYGDVKQRICYKLINTAENEELLEDTPHIEFMDLSIVFQCILSLEGFRTASILIRNVHLKLWDVTPEDLYQQAKVNTPKFMPHEIKSMEETLCDLMQEENPDEFDYDECMKELSDSVPMYVLSNKSRTEGAACILYPNLIRDFADEINSSFYIIPSSIHELLLIPTEHENEDENTEIKNMIREINNTQVRKEERLSYSLYYYDNDDGKIVRL